MFSERKVTKSSQKVKEGNGHYGQRRQFLDCGEWVRVDPRQQRSRGLGRPTEEVRKSRIIESDRPAAPTYQL